MFGNSCSWGDDVGDDVGDGSLLYRIPAPFQIWWCFVIYFTKKLNL